MPQSFMGSGVRAINLKHCLNLVSVKTQAFRACFSLRTVVFPLTRMDLIGCEAFKDCEKLGPVVFLPASVQVLRYPFAGCHSIEKVVVNEIDLLWGPRFQLGVPPAVNVSSRSHINGLGNQNCSDQLSYYFKSKNIRFYHRETIMDVVIYLVYILQHPCGANQGIKTLPTEIITHILSFYNIADFPYA